MERGREGATLIASVFFLPSFSGPRVLPPRSVAKNGEGYYTHIDNLNYLLNVCCILIN
jgi:hypothetical protein